MKYLYQPPRIVQSIFKGFVWHSTKDKILLTFDDGPNPATTEKILKTLNEENIQALFFCVGNNVKRYPELAKSIFIENHLLGNHSFDHKIVSKISRDELKNQIISTNQQIEEVTAYKPKYFRPPYGKYPIRLRRQLSEYNMKNVMWSLLTYDYKNDLKVVKFAVNNYMVKNSIIVLHDSDKSASIICDSIKYIRDEVSNKNFQFGTPEECLK